MATRPYDLAFFEKPIRLIPLGYITEAGASHIQTVGDYVGGTRRGVILEPEHAAFLHSLRPDTVERDIPVPEQQLLVDMANAHLVVPLPTDATLADLDIIPVMRKSVSVERDLGDAGWRLRATDGLAFDVNDLEYRFISAFDGQHSLAEIAEEVRASVIADLFGSHADILAIEHASVRAIDLQLTTVALKLVATLRALDVTTVEP